MNPVICSPQILNPAFGISPLRFNYPTVSRKDNTFTIRSLKENDSSIPTAESKGSSEQLRRNAYFPPQIDRSQVMWDFVFMPGLGPEARSITTTLKSQPEIYNKTRKDVVLGKSGQFQLPSYVVSSDYTPFVLHMFCKKMRGCGCDGDIGCDDGSGLFGRAFGAPLVVEFMPDSPTRPLMLRKNSGVEIGVMTMEVRFVAAMDPDDFGEVTIRLTFFFSVVHCL
ncbi:hypothetical protein EGR_11144 [Echinococcus granulosus]|uniref:Uncharacterized protein n=1 Tax=Echinococcus granulosus TaxID=6210 RepID=W6TZ44_ECHGR|nr:hypothetical protein EGR_11144 [Echinococcus granulosus]EUB53998.1 hypothetical protein EGR_11144 [Echinococcus granulosus]